MHGWDSSNRRAELPSDWPAIKRRIKARDGHQCTDTLPSGRRCPRGRATGHRLEVDHRDNPLDHSDGNLQTLCSEHHAQKTQEESHRARVLPPVKRRTEKHPGEARSI